MNNLSPELRQNRCSLVGIHLGVNKAAFLAFLALSLLAHAVCFYIFQVVYPPTVTLLPPPARVALITPASEEGRTLLRWIDAEDPAVAFTTHRPPEARLRALPKVEHVPSYHAMEPTLKELPPFEIDSRAPDSQPPGRGTVYAPEERFCWRPDPNICFVFKRARCFWACDIAGAEVRRFEPEKRLKQFVFAWP